MAAGAEDVDGVQGFGSALAACADRDLYTGLYQADGAQESKSPFSQHPFYDQVAECGCDFTQDCFVFMDSPWSGGEDGLALVGFYAIVLLSSGFSSSRGVLGLFGWSLRFPFFIFGSIVFELMLGL